MSAQIAYTHDQTRWVYPDWYYGFEKSFTDAETNAEVTMEFLMFDTVIADTVVVNGMRECSAEIRAEHPHLRYVPAGMPTAEEQWEWLETKMKASTADYLRVPGRSLPRAVRLLARSGSGHARAAEVAARNVPRQRLHVRPRPLPGAHRRGQGSGLRPLRLRV